MLTVRLLLPIALGMLLMGPMACQTASDETSERPDGQLSYNFDVRPILSDKCFACHGPDENTREAGLRLDEEASAYAALATNPKLHPIVPGKPNQSLVYQLISTQDTSKVMPPIGSNLKLTEAEIKTIKQWIEQGAVYEKHWSFVPPKKQDPPKARNTEWVKNPIDNFLLQKMERVGLKPNEEASPTHLLKRLSLDITGLPPTLEQIQSFKIEEYDKTVDALLASPAFGEKMAVHWLDIARYADSYGYQDDGYRTQWPWRDWIINAFNKNMSYKDFVTWQLAGDLLPNPTKEQLLATAFNRNHKITEEGGIIPEEYRVSYVADRTDLFGKAFLGITVECARCHDHKYDPISQKDYFSLYAFFNNIREKGIESVIGGPETYAKQPYMEITKSDIDTLLRFINQPDTTQLIVSIMGELPEAERRKSYILNRGEYDQPTEEVHPATPASVLQFSDKYPQNRLGLTQWLFDKENPLTARVYVNILWQEFFGNGLVKTAGDFGMQGELPSHPALLDWLAVEFMESGWNIKHIIKLMVTSATYRQSSVISSDKYAKDPENIYLARGPRYRISAELVRDVVLSTSGLLVPTIGGPSVKPYQPAGLWEGATSGRGLLSIYKQDKGSRLYRRGIYTLIKRTVPPPSMAIFDASNRDICEVKRLKTNTPLQALVMMNDPTILEASRVLAGKILKTTTDPTERITRAFETVVCRSPKEKELELLSKYYQKQLETLQPTEAKKIVSVGLYPQDNTLPPVEHAALMRVVNTLYNLEETITKS